MANHYEWLGISPGSNPVEVKAAYHAKLREFPAHTYPQEFKEIRAAYEALRKGQNQYEDFLKIRPLKAELEPEVLEKVREKVMSQLEISIDDLIRATF